MPFNYTPIEEGDAFNAASINNRTTVLANAVNNIAPDDVEREALNAQHLPSLWPGAFVTNPMRTGPSSQVVAEQYKNGLPEAAAPGPVNYQAFSTGAPNAPYGAVSGAITDASSLGWRIVCYNAASGTTNKAETTFGGTSLSAQGLRGVYTRGWVEVRDASTSVFLQEDTNTTRRCLLVAIGFQDFSGDRYIVERSVRWYSHQSSRFGPAGTGTFLTDADLAAGDGSLAATFLVVASRRRLNFGTTDERSSSPYIFRYGHAAIPIRAGAL